MIFFWLRLSRDLFQRIAMGDRIFWYQDMDHLMYKQTIQRKVGFEMGVFVALTFLSQHL
jgi:hypothetical protein